jgi:arylsulfatase A-like enzyme
VRALRADHTAWALVAFGGVLLAATGCHHGPSKPTTVVVYVVDTQRADHLGTYGATRPTSPHLDDFAAKSLVFDRALTHASWTLPAVASLLSGLYPAEHRATRDPRDEYRYSHLAPEVTTLATVYHDAGFTTGAWVDNVFLAPEFGLKRGFDVYDYSGGDGSEERSAHATVAAALGWLGTQRGPALLYLHVMEPHLPYMPPEHLRLRFTGPGEPPVPVPFGMGELLGKLMNRLWVPSAEQQDYILKMYDEEVLAADEAFGELLDGLEHAGRLDRAAVVFTADHGEEFWDHGGFEHGHTLFGEILHVPLVIRLPGVPPARLATQVSHVDLFQTLVALSGQQAPAGTHGEDLRIFAADPVRAAAPRVTLSEDCLYGPPLAGITAGSYRLVANLQTRVAQVYHLDDHAQGDTLVTDPTEREPVGNDLMKQLKTLRGDLEMHQPAETTLLDGEKVQKLRALGYVD